MSRIRVIVVDGSAEWREGVEAALSEAPDVESVVPERDPARAVESLRPDRPDVLILGADLPGDHAADVTRTALERRPDLGVLLVAETGTDSADRVIEALEAGAFDFVLKTDGRSTNGAGPDIMARRLLPKIRSFSAAWYSRRARHAFGGGEGLRSMSDEARRRACPAIAAGRRKRGVRPPEVLVMGASTGGPEALARLLPALPGTFPIPILVVQHMPEMFLAPLAAALDRKSRLEVTVTRDEERPRPGQVYLAAGGTHVELARDSKMRLVLRHTFAPPLNGFRPSADLLFSSASRACRGSTVAVILTGMGSDGERGLKDLKNAGARIIAQDEESSVVWGMPGRAVNAGLVDEVLALDRISERIVEWVER